ncbi:biotin--[acetyl-CoA-carboxylase] ligase [Biomaibacter acetigenes]|uniref:Bifunctional ligase/repressor BirA n=1 Tax=Biomaibacter acetigenes TaxID=2316383 RepID=A0A3G2R415_9FIRM|nr:biotin--[acetyl-CoA-carboxylase] ligase [Biomaibacter acetigenes]AYO30210.1 biotin--[acetyl-CoA-carboxylase] ligase [Biomaibacter acetigenes]
MSADKSIAIVRDKKNPDRLLMMMLAARGGYISGEEISRKFGVSRSAIWKQVNHLREMGYEMESSTRLGYRIFKSPDLLFPEEIWSKAELSFLGDRIYYYSTIGSTNSEAKRLAQEGASHGTLIIAEEQTRGKGRMGRVWTSPRGTGIWVSIVLKPQIMPSEAPKLTMLTAVAVTEAITEKIGISAGIKWPNDVLIDGKKVCGILTEMSAETDVVNYVVIGTGINVNNDIFPDEIKDTAISLKIAAGNAVDRIQILAGFLERLEYHYKTAMARGFEPVLNEWRKLCCNLGKPVEIVTRDGSFTGIAEDIDEQGALIVKKTDGKFERVLSGDVSLKYRR